MNIDLTFRNIEQQHYFWHRERNGEFDGAFGNGKTYVGCERAFTHLMTFPKYGMVIGRQEYKALKSTTMKTFFKICPSSLIHTHDKQDGYTVLINGSFIYWMHLDDADEQDLRGLEINSVLLDQAEEIKENIYLVLDARVGRWDKAQVPLYLLRSQLKGDDITEANKLENVSPQLLARFIQTKTKWPRHPKWGHFLVPNYMDVLCNLADEDELHWTYRRYNPESFEKQPDHYYITKEADKDLWDERTYQQVLLRDPEWVDKYIYGKRGRSTAIIHRVPAESIINPEDFDSEIFEKFIKNLIAKAALSRIFDHGESNHPSCCMWSAFINGVHIYYREYIQIGLISAHRQNIHDLSYDEEYASDLADPQIFKKTMQTVSGVKAGFWTVADEYMDTDEIKAPPLFWAPADNNELATRNRINELLQLSPRFQHPLTRISPAPGIYFIQRSNKYPYGCQAAIKQIKSQRRILLGSDNGKNLYSEERDENIPDDAYDCIRYDIAAHNSNKIEAPRKISRNTFAYYNAILKRRPGFRPASIN